MRNLLRLCPLLLAFALLFGTDPAFAGKRVALVLANSAYQHAPLLANPVNDGSVMAKTLKEAGFDIVDSRHDLSALDTRRVLRDFADATRDADIAVVYYAGHGIEVEGSNYLIPVDARLERDTDVYDEALSLDRVLVAVEPAKQLRLVILDACRDNPFGKRMKRTIASRGIGRGLAQVEPTSPNTLIAYSAKAGFTAQDGDGANSPFTVALSKHLATPGLDVRRAFGFVRDDVLKSTGNKQEPFVYGSLGGEDVPLVPVKMTAAAPAAPVANPQADIRRDYELALQLGNRAAWDAFLAQHPDGFYASLAKLQLEKIGAEQAHAAAIAKAKQAEAERDRLAALGAQKDAQAKAAADAKAAEQAQLAAQKAKEQAQQQAAVAEQQRVNLAAAAPGGAPASTAGPAGTNVASLTPATAPADLTRTVQSELGRVGCFSGQADGNWNTSSQRSLSQFNRYAGTKLDVKVASTDALDAVKSKPSRVCPLVCEHGFKVDGDKCTKIVCRDGYAVNDDNECEKKRAAKPAKPALAKRDDGDERPARQRRQSAGAGAADGYGAAAGIAAAAGASRAKGGGQVFCNSGGCRPVHRGCHLEYRGGGGPGNDANAEVCY
ncbi:caspase family protein [Bradyrhizobium sp. 180]|uniref:caspase family protein n=1 Tax=unclassified Bradyrhizobium TaxID=2631580 RepID=UPI001FFC2758|nr:MULTISPECIES: caspase family protein [unclassified Bradyrhizobium]MCK1425645.1 caspase family protein [Bradyrhizobium sp. CW12]MCK1494095.1 caspase family protein [Bradyrhizobium sp. 180]MCK1532203.1 caspase family protein [Bradyrhizobium sp. 182]MCK1594536.1 caspase family protein [Bradyrhizobium sp. 164]MCK1618157.1 caspase family protein [Bradyrhizobium sp. 159]